MTINQNLRKLEKLWKKLKKMIFHDIKVHILNKSKHKHSCKLDLQVQAIKKTFKTALDFIHSNLSSVTK